MNDHCKGCPGKNEEVWDCGECGLEKDNKGDSSKVTIIEPGTVKGIDGKEYYNDKRIIAGHPDDVAAYHKENGSK